MIAFFYVYVIIEVVMFSEKDTDISNLSNISWL